MPPANPNGARDTLTHDALVQRGVRWLKRACSGKNIHYRGSCGVVVPELVSYASEQPDVIGWMNGGASHLIECKASRADFLADRRKRHRQPGGRGVGQFRWYLCPPGLIAAEELPPGWGLLYCHPRKITVEHDAPTNGARDIESELAMMYSLLRRVEVRGELQRCLAPKWGGDSSVGVIVPSKLA